MFKNRHRDGFYFFDRARRRIARAVDARARDDRAARATNAMRDNFTARAPRDTRAMAARARVDGAVLCTHGVHTNTPVVAIRWETAERDARGSTGRETHRNASRGNLCARARGVRARRIAWSSREKGFSSASITFFLAFHQVFGVSWRCARRSRARSGVCARDRARGGCGEPCRMRWRREMAKS